MSNQALVHKNAGAAVLGFVRAAVALIWLIKILTDPFTYMAEFPTASFNPKGILNFVPLSFWELVLDQTWLIAFKGILLILLILFLVGIRPFPLVALATAVALTLHQEMARGFTHTSHQELPALMCVYVLAAFPSADAFSWPARRRQNALKGSYAAALVAMAILVVLPYSAIAAYRIAHSAPEVFTSNTMPHYVGLLAGLDVDVWQPGLKLLEYPVLYPLLKVGFVLTSLLELLSPIALVSRRFRAVWVPGIIAFHLSTSALMHIFFWESVVLVLLLFTTLPQKAVDAGASLMRRLQEVRQEEKVLEPSPSP